MAFCAVVAGCANRGIGPQGGPKDETPPVLVREDPASGTTDFDRKQVNIYFSEYLQLDKVQENVLISPPSRQQPEVKVRGKHVEVNFLDTLLPNTTYSLNFGRAICDYHERVPLVGYTYSFSTGPEIDTLELGGMVVFAENLNPVSGCIVGIHRNPADSALSRLPFTQIARSDSSGIYYIHNIHEGEYRLYALMDASRDYLYQPSEPLAFAPAPVRILPSDEAETPILYLFEEDKQRHYLGRTLREKRHMIQTTFSAPQEQMPAVEADWLSRSLLEVTPRRDTLRFWLLDSADIRNDSLEMRLTYLKSDSLYNLVPKTDTISAVYREPRLTERAKRKIEEAERNRKLKIQSNASTRFEVYDTLQIRFECPVTTVRDSMIRLCYKEDTILRTLPIRAIVPADSAQRAYHVMASLAPNTKYTLILDSAAITDIYGHVCDSTAISLTVRKREDYSTLRVRLAHHDPQAIIQLLNNRDAVVRSARAESEGVLFEYLEPGVYYMRLFMDLDGNGKWTTGDWQRKRQPEPVVYFPSQLNLKANWDFEETFDHLAIDPIDSKPEELIKVYNGRKK